MLVAVPNLKGCITQDISPLSNVVSVDTTSYALLSAILGIASENFTYARLGIAPNLEYVRVDNIAGGYITIGRNVDGSIAKAFPSMTEFEYVLTLEGINLTIADSVSPTDLAITANAPLEIKQLGTNQFNISLTTPVFSSSGNSIDVTGSYPNYDVNTVRGTNGCCD